ncbi:cyclase family protein [Streptomyces sp. OE57]|uniref:cyclase family protein n=1 Tax=Streptomyces lacaronensis TaxID=3379885 RepID=UPI0039B795CD
MASQIDTVGEIDRLAGTLRDYDLVDLSHTLELGIPTFPTHPKYIIADYVSMDDVAEFKQLIMCDHSGTHIDSPSHFVPDHDDPRRIPTADIDVSQLIGRAVVMTFGPFETTSHHIGRAEVQAWEAANESVREGDIVIINTGWSKRWRKVPEGFDYLRGWPGLSGEASSYLRGKGVKAVGIDCISIDPGDVAGADLKAHYEFLPNGVLVLENLTNLDALPPICLFAALPLKIAGGTGSPVRAVAFVAKGNRHA